MICLWCLSVLIGIGLIKIPLTTGGSWPLLLSVALILASSSRQRLAIMLVIISGVSFGLWRGSYVDARINNLNDYIGNKIVVSGVISADPAIGPRNETILKISNLTINERKFPGTARISFDSDKNFQRGDLVDFLGKLKPGYGNYQASITYAKLESHTVTSQPIIKLRNDFASSVRRVIGEPAASLGLGFLLGQRDSLPQEVDDNMRLLGLTHIVVASGYNLTILVRISRRLFAKISKYQALVSSLSMAIAFMMVTGFSPSMTRAGLVTLLSVWAWYYGRNINPLLIILLSAALTALWNPLSLWSDIGWYLSFLSFTGVLLLAPLLTKQIFKGHNPALPLQVIVETVSAQLLTLPLVLLIFGRLPLLSVIANALIVPFIPLAMLMTFAAGLGGVVFGAGAVVLGLPSQILINYMLNVVDVMANISWASIDVVIEPTVMILAYAFIVTAGTVLWRRLRFNYDAVNITE